MSKNSQSKNVPDPKNIPLPFTSEEYDERYKRLRSFMKKAGLDALLVTSHLDFHWLTGGRVDYWSAESPQWIIITENEAIGIVRHLEAGTHKSSSYLKDWIIYFDEGPINPFDPVKTTAKALSDMGLNNKKIGVNQRTMSAEDYLRIQHFLPKADFIPFSIAGVRVRRSQRELENFRRAASVNQQALMDAINFMKPGMSEWGILKYISRKHAELLGTDYSHSAMGATSCQVGSNMMYMHEVRTPREMKKQKIKEGSGLWLEPGVFVKEYVGSMLRTVWFGKPPFQVKRAVEACIEAFELLLENIGPGKTAEEVDNAPRSFLRRKGYTRDFYQHRTGYISSEKWLDGGILSLTPKNPLVLEVGHVFHCPVHVYVPGYGYMGVSEQVAITENGYEVLGDYKRTCPRKFFVKKFSSQNSWIIS